MTGGHAKEDRQPLASPMTRHNLNTGGNLLSLDPSVSFQTRKQTRWALTGNLNCREMNKHILTLVIYLK